MHIDTYTPDHAADDAQRDAVASFLFKHLDQFGDPKEHIRKAIDYALDPGRGGFVIAGRNDEGIIGAVVVNDTGMSGYIPEHILVYIAVDRSQRGQGVGKRLMREAIGAASGSIALHVEPDNPAKLLYESLGFTNKYLEMRLAK